jgi:ADP-heptose:LPS heptosyltransferase
MPRYTGDQKLDLLRALGIQCTDAGPEVFTSSEMLQRGALILESAGIDPEAPFLAVVPASRREYKRWSPEGFIRVLRRFAEETQVASVFLSAGGEESITEPIARRTGGAFVRIDRVSDLMGVLARGRAFFGLDGGAKHLAQALDRPTLTLFGPQNPTVWTRPSSDGRHRFLGGRRPGCAHPCSRGKSPCACLSSVAPERVAEELLDLWLCHVDQRTQSDVSACLDTRLS